MITFEEMDAFMKDIRIMIDDKPYDCKKIVDAIRKTLKAFIEIKKMVNEDVEFEDRGDLDETGLQMEALERLCLFIRDFDPSIN